MNELVKAVKVYFEESPECQKIVEVLPVIHFWIIKDMINTALKHKIVTWRTVYDAVLGDVADSEFFKNQLKKLYKYKRFLEKYYPGSQVAEDLSLARYLINGSYFGFRVRNRLIYKFSKYFDMQTEKSRTIEKQYMDFKCRKNKIYLIGTEDFGNIGDHQISESILEFLKIHCPKYSIFEVTASEYFKHRVFLKKYIKKEDTIVLTGGGNFGNEYELSQNIRDDVIKNWKSNKKIIFPQTIYFTNATEGKERLEKSREIYTQENNVYLFTREEKSYEFAQKT